MGHVVDKPGDDGTARPDGRNGLWEARPLEVTANGGAGDTNRHEAEPLHEFPVATESDASDALNEMLRGVVVSTDGRNRLDQGAYGFGFGVGVAHPAGDGSRREAKELSGFLVGQAHLFLEAEDLESLHRGIEGASSFGKSGQAGAEETVGVAKMSDENEASLMSGDRLLVPVAYSGRCQPPIPVEASHRFRLMPATHSG